MCCPSTKKHGVENFSREILEWCKSKEELNQREIYWIAELNSQDPNIGYNITAGGEGGNTYQYLTPERMSQLRPKLSINNRDADTIQRWKNNLKEAAKGKKNPMYGKHHSDAARRKMSVAKKGKYVPWNKGKHMSEETKHKLSVAQKRRLAALRDAGNCDIPREELVD